jgi:hypothetical protein
MLLLSWRKNSRQERFFYYSALTKRVSADEDEMLGGNVGVGVSLCLFDSGTKLELHTLEEFLPWNRFLGSLKV